MIPLTRRMALLVTTAALAPLLVFGAVAWWTVSSSTRSSVVASNHALAARSAESISLYIQSSLRLLRSVASDLQGTGLSEWQQNRVLRNFVLQIPEFRELTLFDDSGAVLASSRLSRSSLDPISDVPPGEIAILPVELDEDLLPRTQVTLRLRDDTGASLAAELRLETLWRLVDEIRLGGQGRAALIDQSGRLLADGRPGGKARVARGDSIAAHPLANAVGTADDVHDGEDGAEVLAVVSAPIAPVGWRLLLEQPSAEAFAAARRLEQQLLLFVTLALLANIVIGIGAGRSLLRPISDLLAGIRAIGHGQLDQRVTIARDDEFRQLGDAFNAMTDRLRELQQETIRQERQAVFGRIAAGLVHDLAHPIQNINNNCKLILQMHDDPEYRATFTRMVKREFGTIQRTFEDLRNLARPIPLERFAVDAGKLMLDAVDRMQVQASVAGVELAAGAAPPETLLLEGDLFALGRVLRNLALNALQATPPGGRVRIDVDGDETLVRMCVGDTGCGIPADRLHAIFEDFVTTKRRGLGLGLAISRKVVEQMGGTIRVESTVGVGSLFTVEFPRARRTTRP